MLLIKQSFGRMPALLLLLCLLVGGCHARQSQTDSYLASYSAIMFDYRAKAVQLSSRPLPPRKMPAAQKRPILAANLEDVAQADEGFVRRMDTLTPPVPYLELHNATRNMLAVQAVGMRQDAAAMRTGDKAKTDAAFKSDDAANRQAVIRMAAVTKSLGPPFAGAYQKYEQLLHTVYQEK